MNPDSQRFLNAMDAGPAMASSAAGLAFRCDAIQSTQKGSLRVFGPKSEHQGFLSQLPHFASLGEAWQFCDYHHVVAMGLLWRSFGWPTVVIEPRQAAELFFTEVPREPEWPLGPWPTFRVIAPVLGVDVLACLDGTKQFDHHFFDLPRGVHWEADGLTRSYVDEWTERTPTWADESLPMESQRAECVVRNLCMALNVEREAVCGERSGPTNVAMESVDQFEHVYEFRAPTRFDLSGHLSSFFKNERGRKTAVKWVVRGHWRDQRVGPGRQMVKRVWVRPHVKGPSDAPQLVRAMRLGGTDASNPG